MLLDEEQHLLDAVAERIGAMKESLKRMLGDSIEITLQSPADLWPTLADPAQVESAVLNLCLSARDAMPNGGRLQLALCYEHVTASADAASTPTTGAFNAGDYVFLRVTDSGEGMSEHERGCVRKDLRSTLHDQARGPGQRPGSEHDLWRGHPIRW